MRDFNDVINFYIEEHPDETLATILKSTVASKIILARYNLKLSQKALAEKIGVTQPMIAKWENGDYNFTLSQLAKVCIALETDIASLFDVDSNEPVYDNIIKLWVCENSSVAAMTNCEISCSAS